MSAAAGAKTRLASRPPPRGGERRREADVMAEVLRVLRGHPAVAWAERMNSGVARMGGRFVRFGFVGCPDLLGQLKDGRLVGVEVKAGQGALRPEQSDRLAQINAAGGVAFVARGSGDVVRELAAAVWGA